MGSDRFLENMAKEQGLSVWKRDTSIQKRLREVAEDCWLEDMSLEEALIIVRRVYEDREE